MVSHLICWGSSEVAIWLLVIWKQFLRVLFVKRGWLIVVVVAVGREGIVDSAMVGAVV